jgi:ferric-dicitrate binding protein FerR (iron transport regulator)
VHWKRRIQRSEGESMISESDNEDVELLQMAEDWDFKITAGDPASLGEFAAWVRASPQHIRAYLLHVTLAVELKDLND